MELRDQGLTRPKVLILVPFRDSAHYVVTTISKLLLEELQVCGMYLCIIISWPKGILLIDATFWQQSCNSECSHIPSPSADWQIEQDCILVCSTTFPNSSANNIQYLAEPQIHLSTFRANQEDKDGHEYNILIQSHDSPLTDSTFHFSMVPSSCWCMLVHTCII